MMEDQVGLCQPADCISGGPYGSLNPAKRIRLDSGVCL